MAGILVKCYLIIIAVQDGVGQGGEHPHQVAEGEHQAVGGGGPEEIRISNTHEKKIVQKSIQEAV